jgi:hypothetical protein
LNGIGRYGDPKLENSDCDRSTVPFVSNRPACAQSITAKRHVIDTVIAMKKYFFMEDMMPEPLFRSLIEMGRVD